ncbi:hypothetical protein K493DRAFT_137461, partial [Basidiobolus meristosporus CBS 931.73]
VPLNKGSSNDHAAMVHQQVDEVVNIMQENVSNVMDRGEKLEHLNYRADELESGSRRFHRRANQVRKQMWLK